MTEYFVHLSSSLAPNFPWWDVGGAGKAHHDREVFAAELGFEPLGVFLYKWDDEPANVLRGRMDGLQGGLKRNDVVFVQWPMSNGSPNWHHEFVQGIHAFEAKLVYVVDDLYSWRTPTFTDDSADVKKELQYLSQADGLVLHFPAMLTRLQKQAQLHGITLPRAVSFYTASGNRVEQTTVQRELGDGIDYAGDLKKARYLLTMPRDLPLNVYGHRPTDENVVSESEGNLHVFPRVDPEEAPFMLQGAFGLVWDSDSYPEVTGVFGEYERYNSPAKFAMYLAADEPVIVWAGAATAPFVREQGIGLVLNSLDELKFAVAAVSPAAYAQMRANAQRVGRLVRSGAFVKHALLDVVGQLTNHTLEVQA